MDVKGKLLTIYDTSQISDKFRKREFILEFAENPQYPEYLKFECIQDKCELLNDFSEGEEVEVYFNLKGRKWTDRQGEDKYFNSLQAWKIQPANSGAHRTGQETATSAPPPASEPEWLSADDDDNDLPF